MNSKPDFIQTEIFTYRQLLEARYAQLTIIVLLDSKSSFYSVDRTVLFCASTEKGRSRQSMNLLRLENS